MNPDRFERIREILLAVTDLSGSTRTARLDELCGDDAQLREEIESLLAHDMDSIKPLHDSKILGDMIDAFEAGSPSSFAARMPGEVVSHYRLVRCIGRGGVGEVYLAHDSKLDRPVAIKFLAHARKEDPTQERRFINEAKTASSLEHPNIGSIHSFDRDERGQLHIVMGFYGGGSLRERLATGPIDVSTAIELTMQVAAGLGAAHAKGIVHRDLKPGNIMLTEDGTARIIDFGLAKLISQIGLTHTGSSMGTIAYMSPEQVRGEKVDERTDIFSLGATLYEMVTGRMPFEAANDAAVLHRILNDRPHPLPANGPPLPAGLERVLYRAMARRPGDRYQSVADMLHDLRIIHAEAPLRGLIAGRPGRWPRLISVRWAVAALAVVLTGAGVSFWLARRDGAALSGGTEIRRSLVVRPDGSGDLPTIQAALDAAAAGETVHLADGTYVGPGNHDLDFGGKAITLSSLSDDPLACTIDCQGTETEMRRGIDFHNGEGAGSVVRGLSIANGWSRAGGGGITINDASPRIENCILRDNTATNGGGMDVLSNAAPVIQSCLFLGNRASKDGGALYAHRSNPTLNNNWFCRNQADTSGGALKFLTHVSSTIEDCVFHGNYTPSIGGAIALENGSNPIIRFCTLHGNTAGREAGGIRCFNSAPIIENTIIAFSTAGAAMTVAGELLPQLTCCNLFGNADGDWAGVIADQAGVSGNLNVDPLFAEPERGDFHLQIGSPCLPDSGCGGMGARHPSDDGIFAAGIVKPSHRRFVIYPDGSGDAPTIQEAINATSHRDTVLLVNGIYTGPGNCDLDFQGKSIVVKSQSDDPDSCIIDCAGKQDEYHLGVRFESGETRQALLQGITICNGWCGQNGGAICIRSSSPTIRNCTFRGNRANNGRGDGCGGALGASGGSDPLIEACTFLENYARNAGGGITFARTRGYVSDCVFASNYATHGGGGIYLLDSPVNLYGCSFSENGSIRWGSALHFNRGESRGRIENCTITGGHGAAPAVFLRVGASPELRRCLIAFNDPGAAVECEEATIAVRCSNIFGNRGGDWVGCLSELRDAAGNISADPLLCNLAHEGLTVRSGSPCLPANNSCGVLIGAYGEGCRSGERLVVPGDYASITIALAIAASGDTVTLAAGHYLEHDLRLPPGVTLLGLTDDPAAVVIDAAGAGRVLLCDSLAAGVRIEGVTLTGGAAEGIIAHGLGGGLACFASNLEMANCIIHNCAAESGGGVFISATPHAAMRDCVLRDNRAGDQGSGICCRDVGALRLIRCEFTRNRGSFYGGGGALLRCRAMVQDCAFADNTSFRGAGAISMQSCTRFEGCLFAANSVTHGGPGDVGGILNLSGDFGSQVFACTLVDNDSGKRGGVIKAWVCELSVERTIVSGTVNGSALCGSRSRANDRIVNCNFFGNPGGDFGPHFRDHRDLRGNISADPRFVDPAGGNYYLRSDSPCAPDSASRRPRIGAFPVAAR